MKESIEVCLEHQTFSYVEDDCPVQTNSHRYAFATLDRDCDHEHFGVIHCSSMTCANYSEKCPRHRLAGDGGGRCTNS